MTDTKKTRRHDVTVQIRMTRDQLRAIEHESKRLGEGVSTYMRRLALQCALDEQDRRKAIEK